jgi:hypothetical protein
LQRYCGTLLTVVFAVLCSKRHQIPAWFLVAVMKAIGSGSMKFEDF